MARTPKSPDAKPLPTREEVMALIASAKGKMDKRSIARAMGLNTPGKMALKSILKGLERSGVVERKRHVIHHAGSLAPVIVADIFKRDADGDFIAVPTEWDEAMRGPAPQIIVYASRRSAREATPAAGIGDRVLMRVSAKSSEADTGSREDSTTRKRTAMTGDTDGPAYQGAIIKLLSHPAKRALGVYHALPEGGGRLIPIDKKAQGREIVIPAGTEGEAVDGDLVAVDLTRDSKLGLKTGRIRERLGSLKSERTISLIAIHTHEIPHVFSDAALREAAAAREANLKGREDWRDIPLITIDPPDAKDHDDAVHAEEDQDPGNEGGFILHIAIADVAAYVRPGSAMDREALERGNSVYFPDRVVPMLPERISNDLCSLKPGVNRAALGLRAIIDKNGAKLHHTFHRVLIRSAGKLAYQEAQAAIDGRPDDLTGPLLNTILRPLYAAYAALKRGRDAREPLELDLPERKLKLDAAGLVTDVLVPERLDAHRLIEDFMILANVAAAETLEKARIPLLYRAHDAPSLEKMQSLRDFLETIGITLPKQGAVRPELFNRILERVKETPHVMLVNEVILRSQAQAEYSPENIGHFGLNLRRYAHFTSPIRRYADLIVHRGLIKAMKAGDDGLPDTPFETMREIGARVSAAERRAMAAERETTDRLIAQFLADQVGASFSGRITGVTRVGLFVRLEQTGADGFIPAATLGNDYFRFDEAARALTGSRSGESYRLGDGVKVRLMEAQPMAGALRFEMLSEGRYVKVTGGKGRFRSLERLAETDGASRRPGGKPKPGAKAGFRRK